MILTVKEAATLLDASEQFVRIMLQEGKLGGVAFGGADHRKHYAVSPSGIMQWNGWSAERLEAEVDKIRLNGEVDEV